MLKAEPHISASTLPSRARWIPGLLLLLLFAWTALATAWLSDDSFISFRQVLNAIDGVGFTVNHGQRVQAFTHPTWVVALTALVSVTGEIFVTTVVLSIVLSLASILWVLRYAWTLPRDHARPIFISAFLIVLVFSKAFTDYMTSGLENALSFFLVGLVLWQSRLVRDEGHDVWRQRLLFVTLALAVLNRFDHVLLLAPLSLYLLLAIPRAGTLRAVLPGAVLIAAWMSFALVYFGTLLPNTYYAKLLAGHPVDEIHARGAAYFSVTMSRDPVTAALVLSGVIAGVVSASWLNRSISLGIVAYGAYIYNIGGDFMQGRFFAILAYVAVFNLISIDERRKALLVLKAAMLVASLAAIGFGPRPMFSGRDYRNLEFTSGVADERGVWYERFGLLSPRREWPGIDARPSRRLEEYRVTCAGADVLMRRDVLWIDICGLYDAFLSRLPAVRSPDWRVGHSFRKLPTDYGNVLVGRAASLQDPDLREMFDDVQLVVSGPLFSVARARAIARLNLGAPYDFDRKRYTDPSVVIPWSSQVIDVDYERFPHEPPPDGTEWLVRVVEGVVWPQAHIATTFDAGLSIAVQPSIVARAMSISLDGNDAYRVIINGGDFEARIEAREKGGLFSHRLEWPQPFAIALVRIEPMSGDGYYAVGHLLLEAVGR